MNKDFISIADYSREEIEGIFLEIKDKSNLMILSESKKLKSKIDMITKDVDQKINVSIISKERLKDLPKELVFIYGPKNISEAVKGGENEKDE